jgi:uncharacterized protein YcbX
MAHLARIAVYPIKSLDAAVRDRARIVENGGLRSDREYAVVDADGRYVNGKRTEAVHPLRTEYDFEDGHVRSVSIRVGEGTRGGWPGGSDSGSGSDPGPATFALPGETDALASWLSTYFGYEVRIRRERAGGMPDDTDASGPTVIGTGTVEAVAEWFDLTVENVRRRFRASLELGGVEPFWEDRLYAADGPRRFRVGDLELLGDGPCNRCVVPARDPDTGREIEEFQQEFVRRREATLPEWAPRERFDHYFKLMVNTRVPESEWGSPIAVGDGVAVE